MSGGPNDQHLARIESLLSQLREVVHTARQTIQSAPADASSAMLATIAANVDNRSLTAEDFRAFVRNCLAVQKMH